MERNRCSAVYTQVALRLNCSDNSFYINTYTLHFHISHSWSTSEWTYFGRIWIKLSIMIFPWCYVICICSEILCLVAHSQDIYFVYNESEHKCMLWLMFSCVCNLLVKNIGHNILLLFSELSSLSATDIVQTFLIKCWLSYHLDQMTNIIKHIYHINGQPLDFLVW